MATANATINLQTYYNAGWKGWVNGQCYMGFDLTKYYPYILRFNTPSFTGESVSIKFTFGTYRGKGTANVAFRYAICTSDANKNSYVNTANTVSDSYQVATGSSQFSNLAGSGSEYTKSITVSTKNLKASTTYYLYMWAANTSGQYVTMLEPGNHSAVLTYTTAYKLTVSAGEGSTITVNRTSSSYGSTGNLANGASIYPSDVLKITFGANPGYELLTHTVNGSTFTSGNTHTVTAAVTVAATAKVVEVQPQGLIYIDNGTSFEAYQIYIDNGSSWDLYEPYIDNGSSWVLYS